MFRIDPSFFSSLLQVIMIDLVLAGDNAVVTGLAAAGLPADLRRRATLPGTTLEDRIVLAVGSVVTADVAAGAPVMGKR